MARLKIRNVGPIVDGLTGNDEFLSFDGLTVFIGNQGTGKSTVAKVFSTLSWMEKALVRGDFTAAAMCKNGWFKKQLAYQNISNYLKIETHQRPGSHIEYHGNAFQISFSNGELKIVEVEIDAHYSFPKIMYVPAERNFVSTVDRPDLIKRLPLPLYTFLDQFDAAKQQLKGPLDLPVGNVKFEYRKQNKKSILVGTDYQIDLLEASSGFQSLVPLVLVSQNLSKLIRQNGDSSRKAISVEEKKKIRKEIDSIYSNENISEDVRRVLLEKLSARFRYASFLNIVEEPEQNLYPTSQKNILFELLKYKNELPENKLVLTTHSPYIINYLTLAIKANAVKEKIDANESRDKIIEQLNQVVPIDATIGNNEVNIYQIGEDGSINRLPDQYGIPSDANFLNESLAETNDMYARLLEIEDEL
jgi:predicted ATPase